MLWRIAGKSARHDGELVVPEPLDAVRRHLPLKTASGISQHIILCPLEPTPVSVPKWWRPDRSAVAEY